MYREAVASQEANTAMERSHHLTVALYFGMSALEAFLNAQMRAFLAPTKSEEEIFERLRKRKITDKVKAWPAEILGEAVPFERQTLDRIKLFKDIRDNLTHIKTQGHDLYKEVEEINPASVASSIAEYMVRFHEAQKTQFPYWLFGWNYLNPRFGSYEIILINNQQFTYSLQAIGFQIPGAEHSTLETWQRHHLGSFSGYVTVRESIESVARCEPKTIFPFQPKLCRRWWTPEHQLTCGQAG